MAASLAYLFRILGWADTLGKKKGIFPAAISIVWQRSIFHDNNWLRGEGEKNGKLDFLKCISFFF